MVRTAIFIILCYSAIGINAQISVDLESGKNKINKQQKLVYSSYTIGTCLSFGGLYYLWYADNGMSRFKFFNDNKDWLQLDKVGHATSSYQLGEYGIKALRWAGTEDKKAIIHGSGGGLLFLTILEVMDGFANDYGFSYGDMLANSFGTGLLIGQEFLWKEQRLRLKYCFFPSEYAQYRPELLGYNVFSQSLKDYNAQTYWLSVNINSFIKTEIVPDWLNLAFGYGANGLTGGSNNPEFNASGEPIPHFTRIRQYYFSLDIDLHRLNPNSKILKSLFSIFGFIKIPLPAIEFNNDDGLKFHPLFF